MSAGLDFAVVSTGNVYTAIDTYTATSSTSQTIANTYPSYPNGAMNQPGQAYLLPENTFGLLNAKGQGAPLVVRYVRYNSTANPALVAGPAPVYWTDETFTTVSGVFTEGIANGTGSANSLAGFLLPNTTSVSGLTAAQLNGNWCFIAVSGFVSAAYLAAGAVGGLVIGAAGNFTVAAISTTPVASFARVVSVPAGSLGDIIAQCDWTF